MIADLFEVHVPVLELMLRGTLVFWLLFLISVAGMIGVHFVGAEINGARRWLPFGAHSIQPSEFMKPAFIVVTAWLFAESRARDDMRPDDRAGGGKRAMT